MKRRDFIKATAAAALVTSLPESAFGQGSEGEVKQPNILLIFSDQ